MALKTPADPPKPTWRVEAEPVGMNPELKPDVKKGRERQTGDKKDKDKDNVGGVIVYVALGNRQEEVARVGFIRETSENPNKPFRKALDDLLQVGRDTCDVLNKLTPDGPLL